MMEHRAVLHVYTSASEDELAAASLRSPHLVRHEHVDEDHSLEAQRGADVLLLPLAFNSPISETVLTSAPGKFGEYLA